MDGDARLLHQVHPAKLATDISAELVSGVLLWRRHLAWGLVTHLLPPIVASAAVLRWAHVEALRQRPAGRYVLGRTCRRSVAPTTSSRARRPMPL